MTIGKTIAAGALHVKESGFTIIEVLICIAIFAIGILAVAGVQLQTMRVDTNSRLLTEAYQVAGDQIEDIMLWDYNLSNAYPPGPTLDPNPVGTPEYIIGPSGPGNRYQLSYSVMQVAGEPNMKTVSVRVEIINRSLDPIEIEFIKSPIQDIYN